jgi:hypothetical protein
MWALGKRGWPGGLPLVGEEGGAQLWELATPSPIFNKDRDNPQGEVSATVVVRGDGGIDDPNPSFAYLPEKKTVPPPILAVFDPCGPKQILSMQAEKQRFGVDGVCHASSREDRYPR